MSASPATSSPRSTSATGEERWRFDPKLKDSKVGFTTTCRGVTYYKAPEPRGECAERILTATTDARLIAVDAKTGQRCSDFGTNGEVDLLTGMGDVKPGFYYVTSPPTIAQRCRRARRLGRRQRRSARTLGRHSRLRSDQRPTWYGPGTSVAPMCSPRRSETAHTRAARRTRGACSAPTTRSGLVYIPTGNATPDYYGGHRSPESEKFASSVVALDAKTGALRWSFQTTHHDIWDYDVPSQPVLVDSHATRHGDDDARARRADKARRVVSARSHATGTPLADVEERPVPQTDVPHEWTSKTQPFSVGMPSFDREPLTEAKMWGITPIDQMLCRIEFRKPAL